LKKLKSQVEKCEKNIEILEKSSEKHEKSLSNLNSLTESLSHSMNQHEDTLDHHTSEIQRLLKMISSLGSSSPGISSDFYSEFENKLRQVDEKHLKIEEKHASRITDLENSMKHFQELMQKLQDEVRLFKQNLNLMEDRLKSKADRTDLDFLKSLPSGAGISELLLEEIRRDVEMLKKKSDGIASLTNALESLTRRVTALEEKIKAKIDTSEVMNLLKSFKTSEPIQSAPSNISNISFIMQKLSDHDEKLSSLSNFHPSSGDAEIWIAIKDLRSLLDTKASLSDFKSLEERLQEKVIAVCEAMGNKFADRADTKRSLKYLESMIREFIEFGSRKPTGDDAMFAKKPLGGWSCASCETNLEKLKGISAAYYSWNKMPYRDPSDRIARAGPGFSRMLAGIQPDSINTRVKTAKNKIPSQNEEDLGETRPPTAGKKVVRPMSAYHH
jgi:chromosome segregation ATPase